MERSQQRNSPAGARAFFPGAIFLALVLTACTPGVRLGTGSGRPAELMKGTYTLYQYGCHYRDDVENAVILAPEGGRYSFDIYGPAFDYKVRTGVPGADALAKADEFLKCSFYYKTAQLRSVLDPAGNAIGYELRPLYSPLDFGRDDVLTITYSLKDNNRVVVFIRLDRDIERKLNDGKEPFLRDGVDGGGLGK